MATGLNAGQPRFSRLVTGLGVEAGQVIEGSEQVMQSLTTGLCRAADDLPGYVGIGRANVRADATGKKDGEETVDVLQGEFFVLNDGEFPVTSRHLLRKEAVFFTARNTVGVQSKHKVIAGIALGTETLNGPQVWMLISAGM